MHCEGIILSRIPLHIKWFSSYDRLPPPPSLPLSHFGRNRDYHDSARWPDSNAPIYHSSSTGFIPSVVAADLPPRRRRSLWELDSLYDLAVWRIPPETRNLSTAIRSRRLSPLRTASSPHLTNQIASSTGSSFLRRQHLPFTRNLDPRWWGGP